MEDVLKRLEAWVKLSYKQHTTGWTYERSEGNFVDCFQDGYDCAISWAAYEVGLILGMDLEEPDHQED
jgi:hypothetical protein